MCVEFQDEILFFFFGGGGGGGECKTREKIQFSEKWQNGNFGENPKLFYISEDKTNFTVRIASRNLATTSNFVEFQDSRNFMFFEAPGVRCRKTGLRDM